MVHAVCRDGGAQTWHSLFRWISVLAAVAEGASHSGAAARFGVGVASIIPSPLGALCRQRHDGDVGPRDEFGGTTPCTGEIGPLSIIAAHNLERRALDPGGIGSGCSNIDRRKRQMTTRLRRMFAPARDRTQRSGVKIVSKGKRLGEPPAFARERNRSSLRRGVLVSHIPGP